jgi:hypothetical protein
MRVQTGPQEESPIPGRMKNCSSWAKYESGFTGAAAMCNGGHFDGDYYETCPVRFQCKTDTDSKKHLPVMNPSQPFGGTRMIASTPNTGGTPSGFGADPHRWRREQEARLAGFPTSMPSGRPAQVGGAQPARPAYPQAQQVGGYPSVPYPVYYPQPVAPPPQFPAAMQTQYASPIPFHAGGVTPTFLPHDGENIWSRLGKNVAQGMIGSTGWHIFDFARNVDFFGR